MIEFLIICVSPVSWALKIMYGPDRAASLLLEAGRH